MNERDGGDALLKLAAEITGEASLCRSHSTYDNVPSTIKVRTNELAGTIAAAIDGRIRALCGVTVRADVAPVATEIRGEVGDRFERIVGGDVLRSYEIYNVLPSGTREMRLLSSLVGFFDNGVYHVTLSSLRDPALFRFVSSAADRIKGEVGDRFQAVANGEASGADLDVTKIFADGWRVLIEPRGVQYMYTITSLRDPSIFRFISSAADRAEKPKLNELGMTGTEEYEASLVTLAEISAARPIVKGDRFERVAADAYQGKVYTFERLSDLKWRVLHGEVGQWLQSDSELRNPRLWRRIGPVAPVEMAVQAPDEAADGVEFGDMFEQIDGPYEGLGVGIFYGFDSDNDPWVAFVDGSRAWVAIDELTDSSEWRRCGRLAPATKMIEAVDRFTRAWAAFSVESGATFEQVDTAARELSTLAGFKVPFVRPAAPIKTETPGLVHVAKRDGSGETMCRQNSKPRDVVVDEWREKAECMACRVACGSLPRGGR